MKKVSCILILSLGIQITSANEFSKCIGSANLSEEEFKLCQESARSYRAKNLPSPWEKSCKTCPEWANSLTESQWNNLNSTKSCNETSAFPAILSAIAAISSTVLLFMYLKDKQEAKKCMENVKAGLPC